MRLTGEFQHLRSAVSKASHNNKRRPSGEVNRSFYNLRTHIFSHFRNTERDGKPKREKKTSARGNKNVFQRFFLLVSKSEQKKIHVWLWRECVRGNGDAERKCFPHFLLFRYENKLENVHRPQIVASSSIVYLSWSFGWLLHGDGNVLSLEILKRERVGGSLIERWKCFSRLGWRVEMASLYTSCRHV